MTNRIRIKRQFKLSERSIIWIVFSTVLCCVFGLGSFGMIDFIRRLFETSRTPMLLLISGLGGIVVLLSVFVTFYSVRKRALQEKLPGTMMAWFKSHIYIGLLAFVLAIVHAFLAILRSDLSKGSLALFTFLLLIISGIAWRLIYSVFPPVVANSVGNLAVKDTLSKSQIVQIEIDKLLAGKSADFRRGAAEGAITPPGPARSFHAPTSPSAAPAPTPGPGPSNYAALSPARAHPANSPGPAG